VPDAGFAHPRLAAIYDDLDADRSDLDHYVAIVREFEAPFSMSAAAPEYSAASWRRLGSTLLPSPNECVGWKEPPPTFRRLPSKWR
jgi:hypothetical protein